MTSVIHDLDITRTCGVHNESCAGGSRFRLGSGAGIPRGTGFRTYHHCARTLLWLTTGAIMLASVQASNGVNHDNDSPLVAAKNNFNNFLRQEAVESASVPVNKNPGNGIVTGHESFEKTQTIAQGKNNSISYTQNKLSVFLAVIWSCACLALLAHMHGGRQRQCPGHLRQQYLRTSMPLTIRLYEYAIIESDRRCHRPADGLMLPRSAPATPVLPSLRPQRSAAAL